MTQNDKEQDTMPDRLLLAKDWSDRKNTSTEYIRKAHILEVIEGMKVEATICCDGYNQALETIKKEIEG